MTVSFRRCYSRPVNRFLLALLLLLCAVPAQAQLPPGQKAMSVRLVAETARPAAGSTVALALVMSPRPGWHGYWQNPGDAGVGTRIDWQLPKGASAGPIRYPVPERLIVQGLMNYVFEGEHALLVDLRLPPGLAPGMKLPIRGKVDYLVCTDRICVPESAEVAAELEIGDGRSGVAPGFNRYRQALPRPLPEAGRFERLGGRLRIAVPLPASVAVDNPYFYPITDQALVYSAPQSVSRRGDRLIVETEAGQGAPASIEGVLRLGEGQGLSLRALPAEVGPAGRPVGLAAAQTGGGYRAILLALAGALLGGLLLNIMPCVFPILSLKALSLARAGGEERAVRREAIAYAAGAVLACLALGAVLLAVRAGGAAVGWAFQLQDPRVILLLLLLVTAIALNLAGLFELPSLGGRLAAGRTGAFATGALAAFVATPCTGPFMGAALGAALVLPAAAALAVFAGLGLGLALPFLLLGFVPPLRRRLPRPGPWMVRFRHILAAPMVLTALGLAWILERQTGPAGLAVGVAAAAALGLILWWSGRRHGWLALAPAVLAAGAAIALLPTAPAPAEARTAALGAEPFSEARLARLRSEGRPVFVYFTADWCLTCKVNEAAVLDRDEVAKAFAEKKAAVLVGDWTRGDAAIGRFLEKQGRSGVPLYLWYGAGREAEVLPQILTVGRVTGLAS